MNPLSMYEVLKKVNIEGKELIQREMKRLQLLQNIMEGKIIIENTKINLYDLIEDVINRKNEDGLLFDIIYEIPKENAELSVDVKFLRIILDEIIENSRTAIPKSGIIKIEVKRKGLFSIEISDSGIGIMRGDLQKVFTPFFVTNFHRFRGHLGIGLSIVNGLLKFMGGRIDISSEVSKGTKVTVYLT